MMHYRIYDKDIFPGEIFLTYYLEKIYNLTNGLSMC